MNPPLPEPEPSNWLQGPLPRVVASHEDLHTVDVIGREPNSHLQCHPRWLVFHSRNNFDEVKCAVLTIHNADPFRVAFAIKSKTNMFGCFEGYGFLDPGEEKAVKVLLSPCDQWERDVDTMLEQRWKILVENIRIPENVRPKDRAVAVDLAQRIFRRTKIENPMVRMYTKVSVALLRGCDRTNQLNSKE